jgi:hypothetical protein
VIQRCKPKSCLTAEQQWIDKTRCYDREIGYNKSRDATSVRGIKWSDDARVKLSEAFKGRKLSQESIAKRTAKQTGIKRTEETKKRMSEAAKRRCVSKETRLKMEVTKKARSEQRANQRQDP